MEKSFYIGSNLFLMFSRSFESFATFLLRECNVEKIIYKFSIIISCNTTL